MPSTNSSAVSVAKAIQVWGSVSSSMMQASLVAAARRPPLRFQTVQILAEVVVPR
jgi:hypothetical protein